MNQRPARTSSRRRPSASLIMAGALVLLLGACSDDADDSAPRDGANPEEGATEGPEGSDPDSQPAEASGAAGEPPVASFHDGTLELAVDVATVDDDLVLIEGSVTNVGTEAHLILGDFAEPDLSDADRIERNDLSGVILVDWSGGQAHYPAQDDAGGCVCTAFQPGEDRRIEAGEAVDYFVAYKVDDPPTDVTLMAPRFEAVDGLHVG